VPWGLPWVPQGRLKITRDASPGLCSFYISERADRSKSREVREFSGVTADALYQGTTLQAAEKREFLEGDGLQAVHNCFVVNAALAAEGAAFAPYSTFFRSLFSRAVGAQLRSGL
jgi:hypothetical protein